MTNHVEVVDAATLNPAGPDLEPSSPRSGSGVSEVGQATVSSWITSLMARDSGSEHNPKVVGALPTFQIDPSGGSRSLSQVYVDANSGGHVVVPPSTGLDFAPIHISVQNAVATAATAARVQDLHSGQASGAVVQDPAAVLATAGGIDAPPVVFTGPLLDRHIPDGAVLQHSAAARLGAQDPIIDAVARPILASPAATNDGAAVAAAAGGAQQLHLVLQDINGVSNKVALKLENGRVSAAAAPQVQQGPQTQQAQRGLPQLGSLVAGAAGDAVAVEPARMLHHQQATHVMHQQAQAAQAQSQAQPATPKTRWKPNPAQLCLLERHFNSGYTKPTPELYAAVKGAGEAKEAQVSVWLKNRLARSKRIIKTPHAMEAVVLDAAPDTRNNAVSEADNAAPATGTVGQKRPRSEGEDESWDDFEKISQAVLGEVSTALTAVGACDIANLAKDVCGARKVCCYGVGRERFVMQALVMRLCHMGVDAWMVGEPNTPAVGSDDILMASAGPSFYNTVNAICLAAIRAGAKVIAFTGHQTAPLPFADKVVRIPAQPVPSPVSKSPKYEMSNGDAQHKTLPLGSAFEATLWMMFECMCVMIQKKLGVQESEMVARHTNLE